MTRINLRVIKNIAKSDSSSYKITNKSDYLLLLYNSNHFQFELRKSTFLKIIT